MALEESNGVAVAGTARRSRARTHPLTGAPPLIPGLGDDAAVRAGSLGRALAGIRDDLGFQTASLFVRGASGWELLRREGPERAWHGVVDPTIFEGIDQIAEYRDVRSIPGVGPRLARLGCASLAILPIPDGSRLLLDSGRRVPGGGWIGRVGPFVELVSLLSGPGWPSDGGLRSHREMEACDRLFGACQDALARPGSTVEELLGSAQEALGADELYLLLSRGDGYRVLSPDDGRGSIRDVRARVGDSVDHPDAEDLRALALAVGMSSRAVAAAAGRDGAESEILLAGWAEGPALSDATMRIAARTLSTARAAVDARQQSVAAQVDRERTRWAYALHDGLTQTVTGAVLQLDALGKRIQEDPEEAVLTLEHARTEIRRTLAELRGMLFDLTPASDEPQVTGEPLTRYVEDVVKRWRLPARVAVEGDLSKVPPRVLSVAYVVIREALANAAKHAGGRNVTVTLTASDDDLLVSVGDGGRGFTAAEEAAAREAKHFGLDMLRKRVQEVGGQLRVESRAGRGTRVMARLPLRGVVAS